MKQIVKTTLAVIALATLTSEIAVAQQQVAKNRRERILQVLDQSRPNAYVPAGFFLHFENKLGRKAVQDHKDFYRATNMDFVKVFYRQRGFHPAYRLLSPRPGSPDVGSRQRPEEVG